MTSLKLPTLALTPRSRLIVIVVLALLFSLATLYAMSYRIAVPVDGAYYLDGARNILAGRGYSTSLYNEWTGSFETSTANPYGPLTLWPPGISILLAIAGVFSSEVLDSARILHALYLAGTLIIYGLLIYEATSSDIAVLAGMLLMGLSTTVTLGYASIGAEPPYYLCILATVLGIILFLRTKQYRYLWLTAVTSALSLYMRYLGVAVIAAAALSIFLLSKDILQRRLRDAAIVGVTAGLLCVPIFIRNRLIADNIAGDRITSPPPGFSEWVTFGRKVGEWFLPIRILNAIPEVLMVALPIALVIGLVIMIWWAFSATKPSDISTRNALLVLSIFGVLHLGLYLFIILFVDPLPTFNTRQLMAYYLVVSTLMIIAISKLGASNRAVAIGGTALLLMVMFVQASRTIPGVISQAQAGAGYTSRELVESETMDIIENLPDSTSLYSNTNSTVTVNTSRPCFNMPSTIDGVVELEAQLSETGGALIFFDALSEAPLQYDPAELEDILQPDQVERTEDGLIFLYTPNN